MKTTGLCVGEDVECLVETRSGTYWAPAMIEKMNRESVRVCVTLRCGSEKVYTVPTSAIRSAF